MHSKEDPIGSADDAASPGCFTTGADQHEHGGGRPGLVADGSFSECVFDRVQFFAGDPLCYLSIIPHYETTQTP